VGEYRKRFHTDDWYNTAPGIKYKQEVFNKYKKYLSSVATKLSICIDNVFIPKSGMITQEVLDYASSINGKIFLYEFARELAKRYRIALPSIVLREKFEQYGICLKTKCAWLRKVRSASTFDFKAAVCLATMGFGQGVTSDIMGISAEYFRRQIVPHMKGISITNNDIVKTYKTYKDIIDIYAAILKEQSKIIRIPDVREIAEQKIPTVKQTLVKTAKEIETPKFPLTPEQVKTLVESYRNVVKHTSDRDEQAITTAARAIGIRASMPVLHKALFAHEFIDGYKDIPTVPYKSSKPSTVNKDICKRVDAVRSLAKKGKSLNEIMECTKENCAFVSGILAGVLYMDIA
jgi:hypothetical protein